MLIFARYRPITCDQFLDYGQGSKAVGEIRFAWFTVF